MSNCLFVIDGDSYVCPQCGMCYDRSAIHNLDSFHRKCTNPPDLRPAASALGLPNPIPPSLTQTVSRYSAGQPLGPGDWLHIAILKWVGKGPTWKCGCKDRINQMNAWGPDGCREHLDEIVGWMLEEAEKRGWRSAKLPGARWAVKRMVMSAIKESEKLEGSRPKVQGSNFRP